MCSVEFNILLIRGVRILEYTNTNRIVSSRIVRFANRIPGIRELEYSIFEHSRRARALARLEVRFSPGVYVRCGKAVQRRAVDTRDALSPTGAAGDHVVEIR